MNRVGRILAVTAGLSAAGAVMGGLAGAVIGSIGMALSQHNWRTLIELEIWWTGMLFGAGLGVVTGPVGAWLLMRRAPLGLAIAWTTIGTVLGGVIGWFSNPIWGAMIGFLVSAVFIRRRYATRASQPNEPVTSAQGDA